MKFMLVIWCDDVTMVPEWFINGKRDVEVTMDMVEELYQLNYSVTFKPFGRGLRRGPALILDNVKPPQ